ncbi:MAG: 2OG-Fe(II) oxygenase [Cocleimonas sp.]|nr:2OG-Fe(II) oxygenase [Cocleimonas sp.]
MKYQLDKSWKEWIHHNIERGCDKEGIVKILLEHDFYPPLILNEMKYQPTSTEVLTIIQQKEATQLFIPAPFTQKQPISTNNNTPNKRKTTTALDNVHLPLSRKIETDKAHLYVINDFLTHQECDDVIARIKPQCRPSTITSQDEPDKTFRTSQTCDLSHHADYFVKDLNRRIADYLGYEEERSEGIQGQFYQIGNQFKTHSDFFEPNTAEYQQFASEMGQRTWTFMIYLNDVPKGGQTEFTELGITFTPKKGQALAWNSLKSNGDVNRQTLHWAKPILKGEKYVITKWFRTHGSLKNPFIPFLHQKIPAFTPTGFKKTTLPIALFKRISDFYQCNRRDAQNEENGAIGTFIHGKEKKHPSKMIELSTTLRADIFQTLHPMLEEWSGQTLAQSAVYGIREYQRGATLDLHVDRYQTHLISVIINVDQDTQCDWPLYIYDHSARLHKVNLKAGEIVFYESAKIAHGRPEALDGKNYANIFAHTMPIDWEQKAQQLTQQLQSGVLCQRTKFSEYPPT